LGADLGFFSRFGEGGIQERSIFHFGEALRICFLGEGKETKSFIRNEKDKILDSSPQTDKEFSGIQRDEKYMYL